jgi:predicted metal-dependent enzyme (double-stranded beta helix superfamily)
MAQTAVYTMEAFVADVKEVFASTKDPLVQAQAVAGRMKQLLAVPGWLEAAGLPEEEGFGRYDLHLDEESGHPGNGFYLMYSVQTPGQDNLPHDHGSAWVVYGIYQGSIKQTKWRWFYPGEGVDRLQIKETGSFVQKDGAVAFFLPGEIHNTSNLEDGRSVVVRLESQKLDRITRYQYNPADNAVTVMER